MLILQTIMFLLELLIVFTKYIVFVYDFTSTFLDLFIETDYLAI